MEARVLVKQKDWEACSLKDVITLLSQRVEWEGNALAIVPRSKCLHSITIALMMERIPYQLDAPSRTSLL